MNRLIAAAAVLPAFFVTGAFAQTVPEDVAKQLWCGTAMVVAFSNPPEGVTPEQLTQAQAYVEAGTELIAIAVQGHLDAGFTQEAADKAKADIVPVVTEQVIAGTAEPQFAFEDCLAILPGQESSAQSSMSSTESTASSTESTASSTESTASSAESSASSAESAVSSAQ